MPELMLVPKEGSDESLAEGNRLFRGLLKIWKKTVKEDFGSQYRGNIRINEGFYLPGSFNWGNLWFEILKGKKLVWEYAVSTYDTQDSTYDGMFYEDREGNRLPDDYQPTEEESEMFVRMIGEEALEIAATIASDQESEWRR